MKKTLIAVLVTVFVFTTALACVSSEKQTNQKNVIAEEIPTWQSYVIAEKQINMMLCSVSVDSISAITSKKTEMKSSGSKNTFSIQSTTYSVTTISLINGDAVANNEVDYTDRNFVSSKYGLFAGDPGWDPMADLDGDLEVSFNDINIARDNYGVIGD